MRDSAVHRDVLLRFGDHAVAAGFVPTRLIRSPVTGSDGNVEFLALLEKSVATRRDWAALVEPLVAGDRAV